MTVRVVDSAGSELLVQADQQGRHETLGVTAGRATVTAENNEAAASSEIDVDTAHDAVVEMILRRKATPEK